MKKVIELETGKLNLKVNQISDFQLEDLFDFAARNNPKRGFLFLSKVLGKHYPSTPSNILKIHNYLANKLIDLNNNIKDKNTLFIGMAETAIGLGEGIYESFINQTKSINSLFVHTTRYFLDNYKFIPFAEEHSHAPELFLYYPVKSLFQKQFVEAKYLVLIDDEISTGQTFINLIQAYIQLNPNLEKVYIISILNFLTEQRKKEIINTFENLEIDFINCLEANFDFETNTNYIFNNLPATQNTRKCQEKNLLLNTGRLGINESLNYDFSEVFNYIQKDKSILILGTGEFMHLPFKLGFELEKLNYKVKVQSTTRSPILLGNGIKSILKFSDNYNEGIDNFLYNVSANQYDQVLLCYETPFNESLNYLTKTLKTTLNIEFTNNKIMISKPKI